MWISVTLTFLQTSKRHTILSDNDVIANIVTVIDTEQNECEVWAVDCKLHLMIKDGMKTYQSHNHKLLKKVDGD